jgi:hypothetical protein
VNVPSHRFRLCRFVSTGGKAEGVLQEVGDLQRVRPPTEAGKVQGAGLRAHDVQSFGMQAV